MTQHRIVRAPGRALAAALVGLTLLLAPGAGAVSGQAAPTRPRILLTNDDGYDAPGIVALRQALIAGGYEVVVVAPSTNQSGSSARRSSGTLHYARAAPGVWHVDGSPADAVLLAFNVVMKASLPDLVVSGTNSGQNIGTSTSHSGTVGAAVTAVRQGIPAIAISAEIRRPGPAQAETSYISTSDAFGPAGQFAVDVIDRLVARPTADGALLPPGMLLNINYPALRLADVRGVRFLPVSDVDAYDRVYTPTDTPGDVRVSLRVRSADEIEPGTDVSFLSRGYITVNLISANGDAGTAAIEAVSQRLDLERP